MPVALTEASVKAGLSDFGSKVALSESSSKAGGSANGGSCSSHVLQIAAMTVDDVVQWLADVGLGEYAEVRAFVHAYFRLCSVMCLFLFLQGSSFTCGDSVVQKDSCRICSQLHHLRMFACMHACMHVFVYLHVWIYACMYLSPVH